MARQLNEMSFGEIIELAESLGWQDEYGDADSGNWSPEECDACEEEARQFILANS